MDCVVPLCVAIGIAVRLASSSGFPMRWATEEATVIIALRCPIRFDSDSARKVPDSIRFVRDFTAADSMRFDSCSILQHPIRSDSIRHRKHGCPIRCDSIRFCLSPDSIRFDLRLRCYVAAPIRFDSIRSKVVDSIRFDSIRLRFL